MRRRAPIAATGRLLRRRAATVGLAAVLSAGTSAGVAWAAISSADPDTGNRVAVGTVVLTDNDGGTAMLGLSGARSGDRDTSCVRVASSGTLPAELRHWATVSGALAPSLDLEVTRGTDATPTFDSCATFRPDASNYAGAGPGVLYSGPLSGFPASWTAGIVDPAEDSYPVVVRAASGLISYWRLGESSGTTAADLAGANPGTYNSSTLGVAGALDQDPDPAVGLTANNANVRIPDSASLDVTGALSLSLWVKTNPFSRTSQTVLAKGDTAYRLQRSTVNPNALAFGTTGLSSVTLDGSRSVNDGAWHHVVATWDPATQTKRLWVDGIKDAEATGVTGTLGTNASQLRIGDNPDVNGRNWDGWVDDVALYGRALTATEVADQRAAGLAGNPAGASEIWRNGTSRVYRYQVTLNGGATTEGQSASAAFTWEARNR